MRTKAYLLGREATYINETMVEIAKTALDDAGIEPTSKAIHDFIQGYTAGMNDELADLKSRLED